MIVLINFDIQMAWFFFQVDSRLHRTSVASVRSFNGNRFSNDFSSLDVRHLTETQCKY